MQQLVLIRLALASTMCAVLFAAVPTVQATIYITMEYDNDPFLSKPELAYAINAGAATWSHWLAGTTEMQLNFEIKRDDSNPRSLAGMSTEYKPFDSLMFPRALWKYRDNVLSDTERDGTMSVGTDRTDWYAPGREAEEDFLTWYTRTGGKTPAGLLDLTTVAIHEIAHALGQASSYNDAETRWGEDDDGVLTLVPWDTFLRDENDAVPTAGAGGAFNVTGDVTFTGFRAGVMFGGPVPIYSPDPFEGGSSLSHTAVADISNSNWLVGITNPIGLAGFAQHGLYDYEQAIFQDLGWEFRIPANLHINTWWGQTDIRVGLEEAGTSLPTAEWHDGTHWRGADSTGEFLTGLSPIFTTDVYFHMEDAQSDYTLEVHRLAIVGTLRMGGAAGATATIAIHQGTLRVESEQFATLIGDEAGANSEIWLAGEQSGLEVVQNLTVGQFGSGKLTVIRGSSVENQDGTIAWGSGSIGSATVKDAGSTWINRGNLSVGYSGSGDLQIDAGGHVSSLVGAVGHNPGSMGTAWIDGDGASWTSNELQIGSAGEGWLTIDARGRASSTLATIGTFASGLGIVAVRGAGSNWTNSGQLSVGSQGSGTLSILSGGHVISTRGFIGTFSGARGDATVNAASSTWTNGEYLVVGFSGEGSLSIETGGTVSQPNAFIGYGPGSIGSVTVIGSGSKWQAAGSLFVGGSATQAGGAGALTVRDSAVVSASNVQIWSTGSLGGDGTVEAHIISDGRVLPGNSAGVLHIVGNYTQHVGAALEIELGGTVPELQYDLLAVTGAATLDGTLTVSLINSFLPAAGNSFDILDWGSLAGAFAALQLPELGGGLIWNTTQLYTTGLITVIAPGLPGDYNQNGSVDAADYVVWRNNAGTLTRLPNDPLGGTIDSRQYNQWRANFGVTAAGGATAGLPSNAAVPEPTTVWWSVVWGALWSQLRSQRIRRARRAATDESSSHKHGHLLAGQDLDECSGTA